MVLTVTINPLLERRLFYSSVNKGKVNRSSNQVFQTGGKGINVSRQLDVLGIKNIALTYLGGPTGKLMRNTLIAEGINFTAVSTKNDLRSATVVIEDETNIVTSYFSPDFEINQKEADEFKNKLEKMIPNCSIVVFSGSSPKGPAEEIFPFGIEIANKHGKIAIVDTYGNHYKNCLEAAPFCVHNNVQEIKKSLNITLSSEKKKIEFLGKLYENSVKMSFLTDGSNNFYVSKFDFFYRITPPKIVEKDATGSGDSFVSGIIFGLEKSLVFDDFVKFATALGAENACDIKTSVVEKKHADELLKKISIIPVGKKMKILDDSPNY